MNCFVYQREGGWDELKGEYLAVAVAGPVVESKMSITQLINP